MNSLFEALKSAADGAFVVDDELRIVYWNEAAESSLGFDNEEVVGQFCYQILCGYDDDRQLVCRERCQVSESILNSTPVPNYDINMTTKNGSNSWLNMTVFKYRLDRSNGKKLIVHLFHVLNQRNFVEEYTAQMIDAIKRYQDIPVENKIEVKRPPEILTNREREILSLLARGYGTKEICEQLFISSNTVRNHIQHILQKFQVHTRLEAVTHAIKTNLISY